LKETQETQEETGKNPGFFQCGYYWQQEIAAIKAVVGVAAASVAANAAAVATAEANLIAAGTLARALSRNHKAACQNSNEHLLAAAAKAVNI
jgi:hypothetical protein